MSLSNRQQDISHDVPKGVQPSPLGHYFRCCVENGYPDCIGAGMTVLDPIGVLHVDALGAEPLTGIVARAQGLARFGIYPSAMRGTRQRRSLSNAVSEHSLIINGTFCGLIPGCGPNIP